MAIFTESQVDKSPRLTNAARCTFGAQPRQSPKIPFCARIFLKPRVKTSKNISWEGFEKWYETFIQLSNQVAPTAAKGTNLQMKKSFKLAKCMKSEDFSFQL